MQTFDVVIIGGGLIGCSIAFELANEGLKIIVLDKQEPGREASWAAAGMLSPAPEFSGDVPLVPLARASLEMYPNFVRAVEDESGKAAAYAQQGTIQIFLGANAERERDNMVRQHERLGLCAEAVSTTSARRIQPSIPRIASALAFLPNEAIVEPRLLMDAVLHAALRRGALVRANCAVNSLLYEQDRCVGILTTEKIVGRYVVLAAGCFSAEVIANANRCTPPVPTRPIRGQMVALRPQGCRFEQVLRSEKGYVVPRRDGRVVAGSTSEEVGFEKKVTAGGLHQILDSALELCPDLASAEVLETWCGLRPGTPDALPILGPSETDGLIVATGHYRNGILLAPITAQLVREWITAGRTSFDAKQFSPRRFSASPQHGRTFTNSPTASNF